jgi:hypothetical protein
MISQKQIFTSVSLAVLVLLGVLTWRWPRRPQGPVLQVSPAAIDLGVIDRDAKVTGKLTITNAGSSDLTIVRTTADCGCAVVSVSQPILRPGENADVSLRFDASGYMRRVHKKILIESNDPASPQKIIPLCAYVRVGVRVDATQAFLGSLRNGDSRSKSIHVLRDHGSSVGPIEVLNLPPEIKAVISDWSLGDQIDLATITLTAKVSGQPVGTRIQQAVVLVSGDQRFPLELQYEVLPVLQYHPPRVILSQESRTPVEVTLQWSSAKRPQIEKMLSLEGKCRATVTRWKQDSCVVEIVMDTKSTLGFDVLQITYNSEPGGVETIHLPIQVVAIRQ